MNATPRKSAYLAAGIALMAAGIAIAALAPAIAAGRALAACIAGLLGLAAFIRSGVLQ